MQQSETWDLYDKFRNVTGKTIERGENIPYGLYHLVVFAIVFNSTGELLIQRRASDAIGWPGLWDFTAGGSACVGETSQEAAQRELFEEVGVSCDLSDARPHFTTYDQSMIVDYYIIKQDLDPFKLALQAEEVQAVRWAGKEEILRMIDDGTFVPLKKGLVEFTFDMRLGHGVTT
ncbi:MAG: NUDIX domain-containing protein [Oscillospiraceae bacterium]|nr:NUDIX domain-containing protein [Oscillospiraceae bacterium]